MFLLLKCKTFVLGKEDRKGDGNYTGDDPGG